MRRVGHGFKNSAGRKTLRTGFAIDANYVSVIERRHGLSRGVLDVVTAARLKTDLVQTTPE